MPGPVDNDLLRLLRLQHTDRTWWDSFVGHTCTSDQRTSYYPSQGFRCSTHVCWHRRPSKDMVDNQRLGRRPYTGKRRSWLTKMMQVWGESLSMIWRRWDVIGETLLACSECNEVGLERNMDIADCCTTRLNYKFISLSTCKNRWRWWLYK